MDILSLGQFGAAAMLGPQRCLPAAIDIHCRGDNGES
jgi:hypothetical protein